MILIESRKMKPITSNITCIPSYTINVLRFQNVGQLRLIISIQTFSDELIQKTMKLNGQCIQLLGKIFRSKSGDGLGVRRSKI